MSRFTYDSGETILVRRHVETWARTDSLHYLSVAISDAALRAACDGIGSEVELLGAPKLVDARVGALVAAVNEERIAGFPSGRLFLDSVEQALAVALVNGHAVRHHFCAGAPRRTRPHTLAKGYGIGACGDRGRAESP